ncbi:MAG: protease pro-enzyme activation domain-containing protein [Terracidiphilus sp.]|jgi:kumamolisin
MPNSGKNKPREIPQHYSKLNGSERQAAPNAVLVRPADASQKIEVSIVLRRRLDGPQIPDFEYFANTHPKDRPQLSEEEFAAKYGAAPDDISRVVEFARSHGFEIVESHAGRRTVIVSGTVAQMEGAFAVTLSEYKHDYAEGRNLEPKSETYRGREGFIHVPAELSEIIVGVFGLDNRRVAKRAAAGDPPNTFPLTVPELTALYDFPKNSAAGQTIAILSEGGYKQSDLNTYYAGLPASYTSLYSMPTIKPISVTAPNGFPDGETTQDICIAFSAAPGANVSVYFTAFSQFGWHQTLNRVIHPNPGDAPCSVISTSFYMSNGDDPATLAAEGISLSWVQAVHMSLQDAAIKGVTFCVCSADFGVNMSAYFGVFDGKQHVTYPASDPWALGVGGTTVGNIVGATFDEYVWNDPSGGSDWGTTGGGVSDHFRWLPPYQVGVGVPRSLIDGHVGRGVPDVAANASWNSGISGIVVNGVPTRGNGTSASTPLWAGLIAVLNAAIGTRLGFVNPTLYALGSTVFRDIDPPPGPLDNGNGGVPGYPAGPGWDACTGWGSPRGGRLLAALAHEPAVATAIASGGNFGNVCRGSFRDELLTINNAALPPIGNVPTLASLGLLSISKITSSSPDFLVPDVSSYPLIVRAAESIDVVLRFQPATSGPKNGKISIYSNSASSPHTIAVTGNAPYGVLAVTGSTCFGGVKACSCAERTISICNVGHCILDVTGVEFKRKSPHWKLVNNPFPAALHPGSCLGVVIRYHATERIARLCELVIASDDPTTPIKTLDVMAYTIWNECGCKHRCEDCKKGHCEQHQSDCSCGEGLAGCCDEYETHGS